MSRVHHVRFVVGLPGAGKTTALRALASPPDVRINDKDVRWTLKAPYAFIGLYEGTGLENSSNMGGDRVARHGNRLSLEYWKRNILPDPQYTMTFLDGEMFLWTSHLDALRGDLNFIPAEQMEKHFREGGLYFKTYNAIISADETRFPAWKGSTETPQVTVSCIYLTVSPETSLRRRREREASGMSLGATVCDDKHMATASSKQRNFAQKFKEEASTPFFLGGGSALKFLELDVEGLSPEEVTKAILEFKVPE